VAAECSVTRAYPVIIPVPQSYPTTRTRERFARKSRIGN
jgi:hypothetical protein